MGVLWGVGPSTFHHMPRIDPKDKLQVHNAKWHSSKSAKKSCGSSHLIGIVYHCLSQFSSPPIPSPKLWCYPVARDSPMVLMSLNSFDLDGNIMAIYGILSSTSNMLLKTVVYLGDSWNIKHHDEKMSV